jgi:hypothetical protein
MGLIQAILVGAGTLALIYQMIHERAWLQDGFLLSGLILSTFMITPLSRPLWDYIPLLPFAQFPWRFLSVQACFGVVVTAALLDLWPRKTRLGAALLLGGVLAVAGLGA